MDQRLFRALNFFDSAWPGPLVRQTEQQSAGRRARWAAEYQVGLKASDSLAQRGGGGGGGVGWGLGAILPWLLRSAKQTIRFLIMISRVIIYAKVARLPVLERRGRCFPPPGKQDTHFHTFH